MASPSGQVVQYAVVGDPATAPGHNGQVCTPVGPGRPTANGDLGADSMAVGYAQQLAQTITGTQTALGTNPLVSAVLPCPMPADYGGFGWFSDQNGLEVGSACEGNFGPRFDLRRNNSNILVAGKRFLVQSLWKRGSGCTMQL